MKTKGAETEITISSGLSILLDELEEELQNVLKLLAQLRLPGLSQDQAELVLGELSTAITHLHEHTRGLDEIILEAEIQGGS